jgi:hypothetical protein
MRASSGASHPPGRSCVAVACPNPLVVIAFGGTWNSAFCLVNRKRWAKNDRTEQENCLRPRITQRGFKPPCDPGVPPKEFPSFLRGSARNTRAAQDSGYLGGILRAIPIPVAQAFLPVHLPPRISVLCSLWLDTFRSDINCTTRVSLSGPLLLQRPEEPLCKPLHFQLQWSAERKASHAHLRIPLQRLQHALRAARHEFIDAHCLPEVFQHQAHLAAIRLQRQHQIERLFRIRLFQRGKLLRVHSAFLRLPLAPHFLPPASLSFAHLVPEAKLLCLRARPDLQRTTRTRARSWRRWRRSDNHAGTAIDNA